MGNVIRMMTWGNVLPEWQKVAERSVDDLLDLARELFAELSPAADTADDNNPDQARRLRLITNELNDRAARLAPPEVATCSCGQTFGTPEELDDHFLEIFIPEDSRTPEGHLHLEVTP